MAEKKRAYRWAPRGGGSKGGTGGVRGLVNERTFLILAGIALALALLCLFLVIRGSTSTTSDGYLDGIFLEEALNEVEQARVKASQLSRIGGSMTMQLLAETRQHLYSLTLLNKLGQEVLGKREAFAASADIAGAVTALDACETKLLEGLAIDSQLTDLWASISVLTESIQELR